MISLCIFHYAYNMENKSDLYSSWYYHTYDSVLVNDYDISLLVDKSIMLQYLIFYRVHY